MVLGTDALSEEQVKSIENDINEKHGAKFDKIYEFAYCKYNTEYDMLLNFFKAFVPKMSVLTGWNFINFNWVFFSNRPRKLGINPSYASVTRHLKEPKQMNKYDEMPAHRIIVDYMQLFQKWDTAIKVKESDALDFVSDKLLGVKKIGYDANLKYLYESSFRDFVYYNAINSVLVQLIHEQQKYIDILYGIATLSRIPVTTAFSTLAVTEGILRKKLRDEKNIILCRDETESESDDDEEQIKGGFVLPPKTGMASWTTCYDFAILVPYNNETI